MSGFFSAKPATTSLQTYERLNSKIRFKRAGDCLFTGLIFQDVVSYLVSRLLYRCCEALFLYCHGRNQTHSAIYFNPSYNNVFFFLAFLISFPPFYPLTSNAKPQWCSDACDRVAVHVACTDGFEYFVVLLHVLKPCHGEIWLLICSAFARTTCVDPLQL